MVGGAKLTPATALCLLRAAACTCCSPGMAGRSPPWALLGTISLQLRWGGHRDVKEHPHGGCKRQLQFLPLSPAHPRQYQGRARLPPVLGATERHLGNPQDQPASPSGQGTPQTGTQRTKIPTGTQGEAAPCCWCQAALALTPQGLCPGDLLLADPARHRD